MLTGADSLLHPDIKLAERNFTEGRVVYALLPPHIPAVFESLTPQGSIGVSFTAHQAAARQYDTAPVIQRDIGAGDSFLTTEADLRWLNVEEPSEALEIYLAPGQLARVADALGASRKVELHSVGGVQDPVIWCAAALLRATLRKGKQLDASAASELFQRLCAHLLFKYSNLYIREKPVGCLNGRRLQRVTAFVEENLSEPILLEDLAHVALLSPYHFLRSFQNTTGMTPSHFLRARRMERARGLLVRREVDLTALSAEVGYASLPHFRDAFVSFFGTTPSRLRQQLFAYKK